MRIGTFNILHGRSLDDGRVDPQRLAAAVKALDVDVLALQEVDRDQERSARADLTAVAAEAMGAVDSQFVAALAGTPGGTWMAATGEEQPGSAAYGVALLTRCPVKSWQVVRLPGLRVPVPVKFRGQRRPVIVHDEPRVAVSAVVDGPLGEMTVVSTHLSVVPGWNAMQLRRVLRTLADAPQPLVVLGDLNIEPPGPERITGMRSLVRVDTFPRDAPDRQLDHVLVRGDLEVVGSPEVPALALSDHRALVVTVTRPGRGSTTAGGGPSARG